jgi:two-component system, cell cycle response regulator
MRIALVDPSRTTRLIVGRMLEARGHEVLPFSDELEALAQIAADPCIEALITSAEYDQKSLIEALDSGADDFIGKPPLAEELYARLRAAERILSMQRELLRLATTAATSSPSCSRRGRCRRRSRSPRI